MHMKILLLGFGSIGLRHASNILGLGLEKNLTIVSKRGIKPIGFQNVSFVKDLCEITTENGITHALICSPTSNHFKDLNYLIKLGIKYIYVEKPVNNTLDGLNEIINNLKSDQKIYVGFDLHFDPGLLKIVELLDSNTIGKVLSANAFVGQELRQWRPHEDFQKGSSASISKGGGVLLDLVHEFDYLFWLLGNPLEVISLIQNNKFLGIETEDLVDVLIRFDSQINATIHLDYHQLNLIRTCIITGEKGTLIWDLVSRTVTQSTDKQIQEIFNYTDFERNDRFISIIQSFLFNENDFRLTSFESGLISLRMVLAAKKSALTCKFERIIDI
jgi:predicted dehydrogenase